MARYTGPKDRLSRREGADIFGKGPKLTRLNVPPGQHGQKRRRGPSQFGTQLREKQKVKRMYGVLERQFRRYIDEALESKGNTGDALLSLLERRLDNVVYRLGFAPTRPAARQFVSHKHVNVNNKKVNIPSYQVKKGDTISISKKMTEMPHVKALLKAEDPKIPEWLERKAAVGRIKKLPIAEDVTEPISIQDIVEFYSR